MTYCFVPPPTTLKISVLLCLLSYRFLSLIPPLTPFLCSQFAVVSAPYGRWVEELSWETKRTEEERQVGRRGGLEWRRAIVWGLGKCSSSEEVWKAPISSGRKEKMRSRHLRWMENTGMSANRWSWCVYVAHLRPVWSKETEVCFCCFVPLRLRATRLRSGLI